MSKKKIEFSFRVNVFVSAIHFAKVFSAITENEFLFLEKKTGEQTYAGQHEIKPKVFTVSTDFIVFNFVI